MLRATPENERPYIGYDNICDQINLSLAFFIIIITISIIFSKIFKSVIFYLKSLKYMQQKIKQI